MKPREFLQVDPATLHLPGSRREGADPIKLHRQLAKYSTSIEGMPPPEVKRCSDGELVIFAGNADHRGSDRAFARAGG